MAFSLGEYQDIFLEEADEQIQELNQNLLELEKRPDDIDIINNIFRAAHSLKSSAAFVGLNDLSDLAHKMENLLQGIRDNTLEITQEIVDVIFKCFDEINSVIDSVASGEEPTQDLTTIINEITAVSERARGEGGAAPNVPAETKEPTAASEDVPKTKFETDHLKQIKEAIDKELQVFEITVYIEKSAQMKWVKAQLVLSNLERDGQIITTFPSTEDLNDDETVKTAFKVILSGEYGVDELSKLCDIDQIEKASFKSINIEKKDGKNLVKIGEAKTVNFIEEETDGEDVVIEIEEKSKVVEVPITPEIEIEEEEELVEHQLIEKEVIKEGGDKKKAPVLKTVKVSIDKLDQLLNTVGELVIANSGFYRLYEEIRKTSADKSIGNEFKNRMEQMARIAKDLQTGIMKTRMVPIGQVFTRYNRLVRDLAKEHNKQIELIIQGEETELDKKVIDAIGEPLLHLIRNAIDHGIESDEERKKIGKTEVAHVTLNSHQGGNQIFVEVSDDGRGLNIDNIKRKAISNGLTTAEAIVNMDDADIYNYIFAPGFSTADKVTDISGRGVGMNVVKEIVNELNGNVSIETEPGMGTRFVMTFPLTLAIIPAIMVKVRNEMYAIPLTDVNETIKISQVDITTIEGHEVINLRGEILSLLRLSRFVGLESSLKEDEKIPVVVVAFGNRKIGLMVDYLEGKLEIVIKSLEQNYRNIEGLAGASILGDGSICLILDVAAMINKVIIEQDRFIKAESSNSYYELEEAHVEEVSDLEELHIGDKKEGVVSEELPSSSLETDSKIQDDSLVNEPFAERPIAEESPIEPEEIDETVSLEDTSEVELDTIREDIFEDETTPVSEAMSKTEDVDDKVKDVLDEFKKELKDNIQSTLDSGGINDHIENNLNISKEDLNEFQLMANVGAANAADSLSRILGKRIDLSIPEVSIKPTESIPQNLGDIDSIYMGVMMPMEGDANATVLFIMDDNIGFKLIEMLYGTSSRETSKLDEDGESALKEITNIIGSSVINVFAEKTDLVLKPNVPIIVHDFMQSIIDSILVMNNMSSDYTILMDTALFFEDDEFIGNLLLLPETDSLKLMMEKMRSNV